MFKMEGRNVLFNNKLNTKLYRCWTYGKGQHIVRQDTHCCHSMGYYFYQQQGIFYVFHSIDRIIQTMSFCTPAVGQLLKEEKTND